jgi:hypothetical protein
MGNFIEQSIRNLSNEYVGLKELLHAFYLVLEFVMISHTV